MDSFLGSFLVQGGFLGIFFPITVNGAEIIQRAVFG